MKLLEIFKAAFVAVGLMAGAAQAASVDFEVGGGTSADVSGQLCGGLTLGCSISASAAGAVGETFSLDVGETYSFDFIDFYVSGNGAFGGIFTVDAILAFATPGGSISASGGGIFGRVSGIITGGALIWNDAVQTIALGNGTIFTIALDQGIAFGRGRSATVQAHVTLDAAPIPLPATALLLLVGVGGMAVVRMRRKPELAA